MVPRPTNPAETPTQLSARYDAVVFDLLSALLDSWSLWNEIAGDADAGRRWRLKYLRLTSAAGRYVPYESLVREAATQSCLPAAHADTLVSRWEDLAPWPEARSTLAALEGPLAVVTNCSEDLARRAASVVGADFAVIVSAERAGWYKPHPQPYRNALAQLELEPERALFVAGSPFDVTGAARVGMDVVWHNRLGLDDPAARTAATAEIHRLDRLPDHLGGNGIIP